MEPETTIATGNELAEKIEYARGDMKIAHRALNYACERAGRSEVGRSLAVARTELETAMLWLEKAYQQAVPATNR